MIRESFHWTGQKKGKGGDDDNATMFSAQKRLIDYCLMSMFGVATSFRLRVRNNFSIFFLFRMFYYFLRRRYHDATHTLVASPALVMNSCEVINAAENIGIFSLSKQNTFGFLSLLAKLNCSLRIPYSPEPQNALVYSLALT